MKNLQKLVDKHKKLVDKVQKADDKLEELTDELYELELELRRLDHRCSSFNPVYNPNGLDTGGMD